MLVWINSKELRGFLLLQQKLSDLIFSCSINVQMSEVTTFRTTADPESWLASGSETLACILLLHLLSDSPQKKSASPRTCQLPGCYSDVGTLNMAF